MPKLVGLRPINWKALRSDEAERLIRERAQDTSNVVMVGHPEDRSDERSILMPDVYKLLQTGFVLDQPVRTAREIGKR